MHFNKVMSLSGDIQSTVGKKPRERLLIKQTDEIVTKPPIYKSHSETTQQNNRPSFHRPQVLNTLIKQQIMVSLLL